MIILTKLLSLLSAISLATAITLDVTSKDSVCAAATLITNGIMDYYEGIRNGGTVGMFQSPYYWWEAGEAFGGMIQTWFFCQNDTYEQIIYDALIHQMGTDKDYIPSNQSLTEGNDDQAFWGLAALEAAERNFTNPYGDNAGISWISLSQAVYNTMWSRWDDASCDGGLRWQIFTWNAGYNYKNTISNAALFHIAARLARFTQNDSYIQTAETVYNWLTNTISFVQLNGDSYTVYDGANIGTDNCSTLSTPEWTYNYGMLLSGCAYMYNFTGNETWLTEVGRYFNGISIFLNSTNIITERLCVLAPPCDNDQRSFKSIFSRNLGQTAKLVPQYHDKILTILQASAAGAAESCNGGTDGHTCGMNWAYGGNDGYYGLGEQISALEVIQNCLIDQFPAPYTQDNGGSSKIDYSAGLDTTATSNAHKMTVTQKDKAGAAVITAIILAVLFALCGWMVF